MDLPTNPHPTSVLVGANPAGALRRVSLALRHTMAHHRDAVWISACSGGVDSLAMTVCAADLASRWQVPFRAVIVDHRLREDSEVEAISVREMLRTLGIEAKVVTVDVDLRHGGIEAAAREARYAALIDEALTALPSISEPSRSAHLTSHPSMGEPTSEMTEPTVAILLGHTMDDQAEGVLVALSRGSGTRSIAGMRELRREHVECRGEVRWVRPLLHVRRSDTKQACRQLDLAAVEDPTNSLDGSWLTHAGHPLPRVAIRHRVLPALAAALGCDPVPALARTARLACDDADALDSLASALTGTITTNLGDEESKSELTSVPMGELWGRLTVDEVAQHPVAVRTRILRAWLTEVYALKNQANPMGEPSGGEGGVAASALTFAHLNALDSLVVDPRGGRRVSLPRGVEVERRGRVLIARHRATNGGA